MAIYLVNQGKTYKYERAGGYLWSPKLNKAGCQNKGYSLMRTVKKGDYILHNSGRKISAISVVQEDCKTGVQPQELKQGKTEKSWNDEGWIIKTQYYDFSTPILTSDLVEWATKNYRENSAFQTNGRLRLQYLCTLDVIHSDYILNKVLNIESNELVCKVIQEAKQSMGIASSENGIKKKRLKPWDEFEVAFLIEKYWEYKNQTLTRAQTIDLVSSSLRKYGQKKGIDVDEKYRNKNGINMKIEELNYLFSHGKSGLKNTSDLFKTMTALYENSFEEYSSVLEEAHRLIDVEEDLAGQKKDVKNNQLKKGPRKKVIAKMARMPKTSDSVLHLHLTKLLSQNKGLSLGAIIKALPEYKKADIEKELKADNYICAAGKYYQTNHIEQFDEMAKALSNVLTKQFNKYDGYTSAKQLYIESKNKLDDFFFYNNSFDSKAEVYDLAKYLFEKIHYEGKSYIFYNNTHIWEKEPPYPKDYSGLLIKLGRNNNGVFSRWGAEEYLDWIGSASPAQTVSNIINNTGKMLFLQYSENQFVLDESLQISKSILDQTVHQINALLEEDDYIPFGEIEDYFYDTLPEISKVVKWSPFLLEDFLRIHDVGFFSVRTSGDDKKVVPAALIRKGSIYQSLEDVIFAEIERDYKLPKVFTSNEFRDYLLEKGFIHGTEKYYSVHNMVPDDLRFFWAENNSVVTVSY